MKVIEKTLKIAALIIIAAVTAQPGWTASRTAKSPVKSPTAKTKPVAVTDEEADNIRIYKLCNRAVVNITSVSAETVMFNIMPSAGTGSGVIISPDGYILTNYHVIKNSSAMRVNLYDGTNCPAQLVGADPANDLAVVKIETPKGIKLTTIPFGDSSQLEVGRRVFAIGNPFGLDRTLSTGIISSLGRTLSTDNGRLIKGIIQTDASINPGNSGGPLLDASGKLIGINTAIVTSQNIHQSAGIGFAIPINIAKRIVPELITHHGVTRPDIGIALVYPLEIGLRVIQVDPEGAAAKAGISGPRLVKSYQGPFTITSVDYSSADVITYVDAIPVKSVDDLLSYLDQKKPGQVVTLTVLRQGRVVKIPVKLTEVSPAQAALPGRTNCQES